MKSERRRERDRYRKERKRERIRVEGTGERDRRGMIVREGGRRERDERVKETLFHRKSQREGTARGRTGGREVQGETG